MKTELLPSVVRNDLQPEIAGLAITSPFAKERAAEPREASSAPSAHITPRQLDVLELLCEGLPNKQIARRLSISEATVKIHVANILRALSVSSRLQAVIAARRLGFTSEAGPGQSAPQDQSLRQRQPVVLRVVWDGISSRSRDADADDLVPAVAG